MIKANIRREYPAHITNCSNPAYVRKCGISDKSLFIADYTKQTNSARDVEVFPNVPPADIDYFSLINNVSLNSCYVTFNNSSFTRPNGNAMSQCECVVFPNTSANDSWIFFAELKYSNLDYRNDANLTKAIRQLYKTQYYYKSKGVFSTTNTCYLLASLPQQSEPFAQTVISPMDLQRLKLNHNIVLRLQNHAEIQDDKIINV